MVRVLNITNNSHKSLINNLKYMSVGEIILIIVLSYVGIGFGVTLANALDDEDYPIGKGCVWPLYFIVEATKAVSALIQEFKEVRDELKNSK